MRLLPAGFLFLVFRAMAPAADLAFEPEANRFSVSFDGESAAAAGDSLRFASGLTVLFEGADASAPGRGEDRASGVSHYLLGNDPVHWRTSVPHFSRVSFGSVYPGIDLLYYGRGRQLEFDFTVAPGADPRKIRLRFANANRLGLTAEGALEMTTEQGSAVLLKAPAAFQDGPDGRVRVRAHYLLDGDRARIELERFDPTRKLVIDPLVVFSTYAGDEFANTANRMAVDSAGNVYVIGSQTIPSPATTPGGSLTLLPDVAISKFDPQGNLVYVTHLGGKGSDQGLSIAVTSLGEAIVGGSTDSPDFPLWNPLQPWYGPASVLMGVPDTYGFIAKLSADGSGLIYSTYFGGHGSSSVNGVATDAAGNAYVTGTTDASDFPVTAGAFQTTGGVSQSPLNIEFTAFVSEINPSGEQLVFSTYLGGNESGCLGTPSGCIGFVTKEGGNAIATDPSGNVSVTGYTSRPDFPVTPGALQTQSSPPAFVAKLKPGGTALVYSTYLIGALYGLPPYSENVGSITKLAVDQSGNAYITGQTASFSIPVTTGAYQSKLDATPNSQGIAPPTDAFVIKLNSSGSAAVFGTYLGGSGNDVANSIAFDAAGNAYVTGITQSSDFPQTDSSFTPGSGFVAELSANGGSLLYSGRFPNGSAGQDIAVDASGNVLVLGSSASLTKLDLAAATTAAVVGVANNFGGAITNLVAPGELVSLYGAVIGPATGAVATLDSTGAVSTQLAGVQVLFDGVPVPLLYVQDQLINAVVPYEVAGQTVTNVQITGQNFKTTFTVGVTSADLLVLRQASGAALVLNSDGTVNSQANPAQAGSIVFLYATGGGAAFESPGLKDGAQNPNSSYSPGLLAASLPDYPQPASLAVLYAGPAPGLLNGVMQINVQLPSQAPNPNATGLISDQLLLVTGLSQDSVTFWWIP